MDAAAGIAGFIKTVLTLKNRQIPPSLHYNEANPRIDFENSPFRVARHLHSWNREIPFRAGVSSFGIGGTNSHIILEEPPKWYGMNPEKRSGRQPRAYPVIGQNRAFSRADERKSDSSFI
ncbi:ketoacyl-synthetase C-terminal extension domain-containing protein [Paenibacillus larvae]|nr:ketoacyl-synthetase C-terminal extension domain-containing protein [Paenibacillus larvae]MDT2276513.1 ketoacyl-synthetase C-terminal extension domain-containing protein [Paenibacillus larvae]